MKNTKYRELMKKLSIILKNEGIYPSISPTKIKAESELSDSVFIQKDMELESVDKPLLMFIHTLLHKFYSGGNRYLGKEDIEELHNRLVPKLNHQYFDKLDLVAKNG